MSPAQPNPPSPRYSAILRRSDQAAVAGLVAAGMLMLVGYWSVHRWGGHELIEIDRAARRTAQFRVDINNAGWAELMQMPEIGETLAQRIIDDRETNGPYTSQQELLRVRGIGPATLERMRPYLLPIAEPGSVAGK